MTIYEAFPIAVAHHQAGRFDLAEQIYRQILAIDPDEPDALHLLGVIASQRGGHAPAVELIGRAISLRPLQPVFHLNLGVNYRELGDMPRAVACFEESLRLGPSARCFALGSALYAAHDLPRAEAACPRRCGWSPPIPKPC